MLHDSVRPEQVVDADAALEFMKEATKLATASELEDIGQRLEEKSELVAAATTPEALAAMDKESFAELLGTMFSLKRKAGRAGHNDGMFGMIRLSCPSRPPTSRLLSVG